MKHRADISWRSDGEFASGRYSRRHEWRFDGGAAVTASASPEVVPTPMSDPQGVDPEEAFVASVSSCHMLWFLSLAHKAGLAVESYSDSAEGEMTRIAAGRMAITRIVLRPRISFAGRQPEADELDRLHHDAHERCFIANSIRSEVVVKPEAAGSASS
jgi:organic hydroperoxide reductase OsmC/OhrA